MIDDKYSFKGLLFHLNIGVGMFCFLEVCKWINQLNVSIETILFKDVEIYCVYNIMYTLRKSVHKFLPQRLFLSATPGTNKLKIWVIVAITSIFNAIGQICILFVQGIAA